MPKMPPGVPDALGGEGRSKVAKELGRLDPFSFWIVPAPSGSAGDFVVAGTTGVFLVLVCAFTGTVDEVRGRTTIAGRSLRGRRSLRAAAKKLSSRLSAASVSARVEPVVCLTHAAAGRARTERGILVTHVGDLAAEIGRRPRAQPANRAQRAARILGMHLSGDERRHFMPTTP
jgi:hypothetical protein